MGRFGKERIAERICSVVKCGVAKFMDPYYQGSAESIAFYFLLSIVPLLLLISQMLGVFDVSAEYVGRWVEENVGGEISQTLHAILNAGSVGIANFVFAVTIVWAGSKAIFAMSRIANYTYTGGETTGVYWKERLRALKTIFVMVFTIVFALVTLVYGELLVQLIVSAVSWAAGDRISVSNLWFFIRWPVGFALYFLTISYGYYVLPMVRLRFRDTLPGGIFASVGLLIATYAFKIFQNNVNLSIYGSLASIVALMLWFYFLAWAFILGMIFNKAWNDTR